MVTPTGLEPVFSP